MGLATNAGSTVAGDDFAQHHSDPASMYVHVCGSVSHGLIPAGPSMATAGVPACQHWIWKLCCTPFPDHTQHEQLVSQHALMRPGAATHVLTRSGLQLSKVHKLNQRQQAIMKSSQTEMHQWKWATKSLISMETPPGQLHAREMDNMSSSHRNGEGDGDFSGVGTGAHRATGMWHGTDRARA